MSIQEKDGLIDCLFSRQDAKLINIKFFRGSKTIISTEEMRAEVCGIARQREAGLVPSSGPTRTGRAKVNVRKLVASL